MPQERQSGQTDGWIDDEETSNVRPIVGWSDLDT